MRALLLPFLLVLAGCTTCPNLPPVPAVNANKLLHVGLFWFKPEITAAQRQEFRGVVLARAAGVDGLETVWAGVPAGTQQASVDNSYGIMVVMRFRDRAALEAWGPSPIHQEIVKTYGDWMQKVQIYDAME